jgi:two-component system sensor histidine kinase KdpD
MARGQQQTDLMEQPQAIAPEKAVVPDIAPTVMQPSQRDQWAYVWAIGASLFTALIATPLFPFFDLANIAMLFILTVVLIAVSFGRGPAVVSTLVGVASFDFFFVAPRFSFAITDYQYLVTFGVMLAVGLITGQLTAGLRYQLSVSSDRETRSRALYKFARELSGALQTEQIFETTRNFTQRTFCAKALVLLPDESGRLMTPSLSKTENPEALQLSVIDMGLAQWAFDHASPAGSGTDTMPASGFSFLPLVAPVRARGVLAIRSDHGHTMLLPEQRQQLDTFAALAAIALERVHYIEVAQDALVKMESERLRNSLLSALSHDLRTPLTSLVGLAESLSMSRPTLSTEQTELAEALHGEALRMSNLVSNLLEMARIQSGNVVFNLQWQYFEEVVGSAIRASARSLVRHEVRTLLSPDLPLVRFDAVLLERVLCNLLENAAKYTPSGSDRCAA